MSFKGPKTAGPFGTSTGAKVGNVGLRTAGTMGASLLGGPIGAGLFNYGWGRMFGGKGSKGPAWTMPSPALAPGMNQFGSSAFPSDLFSGISGFMPGAVSPESITGLANPTFPQPMQLTPGFAPSAPAPNAFQQNPWGNWATPGGSPFFGAQFQQIGGGAGGFVPGGVPTGSWGNGEAFGGSSLTGMFPQTTPMRK